MIDRTYVLLLATIVTATAADLVTAQAASVALWVLFAVLAAATMGSYVYTNKKG